MDLTVKVEGTEDGSKKGWDAQAVANTWNGVKAILEKGVVNAGDRELMLVCERLMGLTVTVDGTEVGGKVWDSRAVASTWNGVKAMLESGVVNLDPKEVGLEGVLAGAKLGGELLEAVKDKPIQAWTDPQLEEVLSQLAQTPTGQPRARAAWCDGVCFACTRACAS